MSRDGDDSDWNASSWLNAYYGVGASFLTERAVRRVAQYQRSIANLTGQGSAEPRLWIGALQSFWSGIADDYGDFLRTYAGVDAGAEPVAVAEGQQPFFNVAVRVNEMAKVDTQVVKLPEDLLAPPFAEAELTTQGFYLVDRCLLRPGRHVKFDPPTVRRDDRGYRIRFMDLPNDLTAGMTLVGTVVAKRTLAKSADGAPSNAESGKAVSAPPPSHVLIAVVQVRII